MKRILFVLGILFFTGIAGVSAQKLEPAETTHDFGTVKHELPKIEHRFKFVNTGTEPLVITRTLTSCNCVKVNYDRKPVPPGAEGWLDVIYEVNKKEAGVFYKTIEVYSNSEEKRNVLVIKGNAIK